MKYTIFANVSERQIIKIKKKTKRELLEDELVFCLQYPNDTVSFLGFEVEYGKI
ncbi:MAG: hypothetical protein Q7J27_03995 [Syntrophales bacterium]|nr:hypothetical protein [Syntrophales bacterium]